MITFTYANNRKKRQRRMNRLVRRMNKIIEKDSMWKGRFYARQAYCYWSPFEDKSGAEFSVCLRFFDRETGMTHDYFECDNRWQVMLPWRMNDFIVKECRVWEEKK